MVTIYGFRGPFVSDNETIEWKIKGPSGYDTTEAEENLKLSLTSCSVPDKQKYKIQYLDF